MSHEATDELGNTLAQADEGLEHSVELTTTPKTHINDLPSEILIHIFSNLDPVDLFTISLVCKRWKFVVSDPETWLNSFKMKFGTPRVFPSLTNSRLWMVEYFDRLKTYKKWNKAVAVHHSYRLINNEFRFIDACLANFNSNEGWGKLLTFSARYGNIAICNLKNGKNQSFIPGGGHVVSSISSYSLNWNYLVMGMFQGELILKNLLTSTSSGTSRRSQQVFSDPDEPLSPITAVALNHFHNMDKYKERTDIVSGSLNGNLTFWNLAGKVKTKFNFEDESILKIKSDFKNFVICNTQTKIYILHYANQDILATIDLGFEIEPSELNTFFAASYFGNPSQGNSLDVDFGDCNIVVSYKSIIKVFNFKQLKDIKTRELILPHDTVVTISKLQTCSETKYNSYNTRNLNIVGRDGLLFANALSDGSAIIWNVRDFTTSEIVPQCRIVPEFNKYSPDISTFIRENVRPITAIALNAMVIAIGGYNGFTNLHNVYTGKFIKEASAKFPKKMTHMYEELIPVNQIILNDIPNETNGAIICGDTIQYFQFGENSLLNSSTSGTSSVHKKKVNSGVVNKHQSKKKIRDEKEDYENQLYLENQRQQMFDKYNGSSDHVEDELSIALAISQSIQNEESDDDEIKKAIELSKQLHLENGGIIDDDESSPYSPSSSSAQPISTTASTSELSSEFEDIDSEELRRIIELSLIEQ